MEIKSKYLFQNNKLSVQYQPRRPNDPHVYFFFYAFYGKIESSEISRVGDIAGRFIITPSGRLVICNSSWKLIKEIFYLIEPNTYFDRNMDQLYLFEDKIQNVFFRWEKEWKMKEIENNDFSFIQEVNQKEEDDLSDEEKRLINYYVEFLKIMVYAIKVILNNTSELENKFGLDRIYAVGPKIYNRLYTYITEHNKFQELVKNDLSSLFNEFNLEFDWIPHRDIIFKQTMKDIEENPLHLEY